MKTILSTNPYKGTIDLYPRDMAVKNYIFDVWRNTARLFGYEEYDTPLVEETLLYKVKSGEEIANTQLYNFTDKGGREIAIRPEMTPSLARMVAAKKNELTLPIRWFNIGKYYRYEKPQKGRRREFVQLNMDILGVETSEAELEIIQYILFFMEAFKAPKDTYEIRINSRYLLDYLFENILKLDSDMKAQVGRAIDNYPKMDKDSFEEYLLVIGLTKTQVKEVVDFLKWDISDLKKVKKESKGAEQLLELFDKAKRLGLTNIRFDPSIMRGFLYYTGTVIEMFDIGGKENPRAMLGGGRYDDLLAIFGQEKLPAFGFAAGDIVFEDYLRTYNLLPKELTQTKVFVPLLDSSLYIHTQKFSEQLREEGINTETQLTTTKLGNQLKYASKSNIPWVAIIGEDEINAKKIQLKNMQTGEQSLVSFEELISIVR
jgi:histidyl-tRNA synthetase